MKISIGLTLAIFLASQAQAAIHTGVYACKRDGKVMKTIKIGSEKLGGIELPVLEFTYPMAPGMVRAGVGTVVRLEAGTHYTLGDMESISFDDNGSVRSDDNCGKIQ